MRRNKALEEYPACRFRNVVFAGSVVRTGYGWDELLETGRVEAILNYVATADWVVALFPKAFETLGLQDLGGAGHDGFSYKDENHKCTQAAKYSQIKYVKGTHSAALQEENWEAIAHFIVHGEELPLPPVLEGKQQSKWVTLGGIVAPAVWLILVALFVAGGVGIWSLGWPESIRAFAMVGYLGLAWTIVTRF